VKQWLETRQVLEAMDAWHAAGVQAALATVVRVSGSAYRHEGAKLLVANDGRTVGNVSGGCLEADVREVARQVIATGTPLLRTYCGGADEIAAWDLGVGCDGAVDILIEPVHGARPRERAAIDAADAHVVITALEPLDGPGAVARICVTATTLHGSLGDVALDQVIVAHARHEWITSARSLRVDCEGRRLFVDVLQPPPRLLVISAGDDAAVLARMASAVGFRVVVADRRPGLLTTERFPAPIGMVPCDAARLAEHVVLDDASFVVIMTHDYADDVAYLRAMLPTPVRYIGMLGPRQRTERILTALRRDGPLDDSRIYGPVGLDIGTDGAEQVALAVVAELLAVKSGRSPMSLRDRRAPIHAAG
jgi:xanthine dehydrogenase accessory factor